LIIFSVNRLLSFLKLYYNNIAVNLLRDPSNRPYRILIEFTYEFTKKYFTKNTFIFPEIIFNPFLILSLYIAFLSFIFTNNTFLASSLISAKRISELNIQPGYK
ncbi:hypothetical protein BKA65DRAFT_414214, partial [Rhexocercosporidium sp. MPI-PUGE-AT-0058]